MPIDIRTSRRNAHLSTTLPDLTMTAFYNKPPVMLTTNDKFIFVNAPTIINAGPRDARRQLRSQLMRRVYLKKYQVSPSQIEHVVDTIEKEEPQKDDADAENSSRDTSTSPPVNIELRQARPESVSAAGSKLPTPPTDGDSDYGCEQCGRGCRSPNHAWPRTLKEKKAKIRSESKQRSVSGSPPLTISASKINPFIALENGAKAPNIDMLLHHYINTLIPALRCGKDWTAGICTEYLQTLPDPLLLNTACLCASVHLEKLLMYSGVDGEHNRHFREQSFYRHKALRALREVLPRPRSTIGTPEFDAIVVSICMLAANDLQGETAMNDSKIDYNPFSYPLPTLGALNVYGYQPVHPVHWNGLIALLNQNGGFLKLGLFASRYKISYTGIKYALHTFTKPAFPICNHKGEDLTGSTPLEILGINSSQLRPHTGDGFRNLETLMIRESIFRPFIELSELAQSMQLLVPRWEDPITRDLIADARNLVQYRFQNLPLLTDDPLLVVDFPVEVEIQAEDSLTRDIISSAFAVYELCWLASHLFTTHVTFAVPSSRRFRVNTVFQLQSSMSRCKLIAENNLYIMRLQLWCMVIGGIAAEDIDVDVRQWMALQIRELCARLGLRDWNEVSEVLNTFAWMEVACDHGGRKLWADVEYLT